MISRVLIISTNRELAPQPVAPIGAAWVAESLHQAGFKVRLLDLSFEKHPEDRVAAEIGEFRPEGIGLSVRNVDNGDFLTPKSFMPGLKEICDTVKNHGEARTIIGGSGFSVMPHEMLEYLGLDYGLVGEGEEAAVLFFRAPTDAQACRINGVVCRGKTEPGTERTEWISNPDLVQPRLHRWVDVKRYLRFEPVLPIQGKRGCTNRCLYCTYNRIEGRQYRLREPAAVVEEISSHIMNSNAHTFEFVDSIFNQPEGYMELLLEEVIRWRLKARFHVSSMSPKGLTREQVRLMERANVTAVGVTPEAASDVTLSSLRKGFTQDEVYRAAELLRKSKVRALWCFLLGGPRESESTMAETVRFINDKIPSKDKAFITVGVRVYPHTGMHEHAIKEGVVSGSDSLLMPSFYFSPNLSPEEARNTLVSGIRSLGKTIFLSDSNFSDMGLVRRLGTAMKLPSPFWRYAGYMNLMLSSNRVINRAW